jgi:hypothetical protein
MNYYKKEKEKECYRLGFQLVSRQSSLYQGSEPLTRAILIMDNKIKIKNKDYVRCTSCNSYIFYSSSILDAEGKSISLDLNGKRHFCSGTERIQHEGQVLKDLQDQLAFANRVEFYSIQLELKDVTK